MGAAQIGMNWDDHKVELSQPQQRLNSTSTNIAAI